LEPKAVSIPSHEPPKDDELNDFLDNLIEREISDDAHVPSSEDASPGEIDGIEQTVTNDEEDNWAKAFEDESDDIQATKNLEQPTAPQDKAKTEQHASDEVEDLWSKAFSDQELETADTTVEKSPADDQKTMLTDFSLESEEDTYGLQYDDDEDADFDEFELKPKKKKFGPFTLPDGKSGSLVIAGIFMALLLIAGSAYFAMQTFAPQELAKIQKQESEIPEGLTPRNNPEDDFFSIENEEPTPLLPSDDITDNEPAQENKTGIAADLAKSEILGKSEGVSQIEAGRGNNPNTFAAINPAETMVTMSAILPVAFDANDIKILSFTLELDLTNQNTAIQMRKTLPVYENIMVASIEDLMSKQFYNDIIYVKEKLRKQFMADFNKSLQGGRVRKARFREFFIQ